MIKIGFKNSDVYGLSIVIEFKNRPYILCFCHHLPERSIKFFGIENYLCARCFGICVGFLIGLLMVFTRHYIPFIFVTILILPLIIDGMLQAVTNYESNNQKRFLTGFCFGIVSVYCNIYFWHYVAH